MAWNKNVPSSSEWASLWPAEAIANWLALENMLKSEHYFPGTGYDGLHKFPVEASLPTGYEGRLTIHNNVLYWYSNGVWRTGAVPTPVDVQIFTADGTWTKPTGAKTVYVEVISGAGGGGGGIASTNNAVKCGGGGGGGGGRLFRVYNASDLGASGPLAVGIGGAGGTGGASPTDGADGGDSHFFGIQYVTRGKGGKKGALGVRVYGGDGGYWSTMSSGNAFSGQGAAGQSAPSSNAEWGGGGGGSSSSVMYPGGSSICGGPGGGSGGSVSADGLTPYAGSAGGISLSYTPGGGGAGGAVSNDGTDGVNGSSVNCGSGGGGSGGSGGPSTVHGGDGGLPGGGGGGAGSTHHASTAGNGGAGGRGEVRVYTFF